MNKFQYLVLCAKNYLTREEGQDLIEYALLVGFISLAAVAAIHSISGELQAVYSAISSELGQA